MNSSSRFRILLVAIGAVVLAALAGFMTSPQRAAGGAAQASITLTNCDAQFCYTHNNTWTLTKEVTGNTVTDGEGQVTWTVTATKSDGGTTFTVQGGLTVTNTGSAPATIGNIVVNLQKPNSPKKGSNAPYVSVAADVADATSGDVATSAKIVAGGSQENAATNAAWGTNNYTVAGAKGTFTEGVGSGSLNFTDASNNTVFSLVPQPLIPVGGSVTLLYSASFNTSILAAGTAYRVEALVTFGNAGARGGSGATANNIDVNGNGSIDADEANVRTVPCRHTLDPLPNAPDECNNSVTVTDTGATNTGTVTTSDPLGFEAFPATISDTTSWNVSVDVDSGEEGGTVCNQADLNGSACGGTLNVIIGYGDIDPNTGQPTPIYATFECAPAAEDSASSCVDISPPGGGCPSSDPFCNDHFCTNGQGGWGAPPNGNNAGDLLANNFAAVYPGGSVEIGIPGAGGYSINLTGAGAVCKYLPAGGGAGSLTGDVTSNASCSPGPSSPSTSSGEFGGQVLALRLNVDFSDSAVTQSGFGDLYYCKLGDPLSGKKVREILAAAETALGGGANPIGYSINGGSGNLSLNALLNDLNNAFENCAAGSFAKTYLSKTPCP